MTERVVLTGGAGFVGTAVAEYLQACGYAVVKLSRQSKAADAGLRTVDYQDETSLESALAGADTVVHLAGTAHVHPGGDATKLYAETVTRLTRRVWTAAGRAGVRRFIHASTLKVYQEPIGDAAIDELSPCRPSTPYGMAKLETERFLSEQAASAGAPALTILRFPPMYGPGMRGSVRHIFKAARLGVPVPLRTPVGRRHFLYVGNAARLIRSIIEGAMPEQVYLPHDPEEWTAASLYRAVYEVSHGRAMPSFLLLPLPGFVAERFKSSPRLSALVANFPLASRYQAAFASVPFLSSLEAIQKVVLAVPDQA